MQVIPVIDIAAGTVVHARAGARASYRPLQSRICAGSAPLDVASALLNVYPFAALYVADLDAIAGAGDNAAEVARIGRRFPHVELWVDGGLPDAPSCRAWRARCGATPVLGTESLRDASVLRALGDDPGGAGWVLSLDFRADRYVGDGNVLNASDQWPARVIVMTLGRVGMDAGPDVARAAQIRARAGDRKVFAAGGVRGGEDLHALAVSGVDGALVATALHTLRIGRIEIDALASA